MERQFLSYTDIITLLKVLVLLVLGYLKATYPQRFKSFLKLIYSNTYVIVYGQTSRASLMRFNILFLSSQILILSMFATFLHTQYGFKTSLPVELNIQSITLMVFAFFLLRWLFQAILGYVFCISDQVSKYIFEKQTYFCYSSLFLCLFSMLFIENISTPSYFGLAVLVLFFLFNALGVLTSFLRRIKNVDGFYFLLYICASEVLPIVILGFNIKLA